jgi:hypothetical protein
MPTPGSATASTGCWPDSGLWLARVRRESRLDDDHERVDDDHERGRVMVAPVLVIERRRGHLVVVSAWTGWPWRSVKCQPLS